MKYQMYRYITLLPLRHIIILSLVLSVLAKPISAFLVQTTDVSYELFDDFEKNESTEKEMKSNSEHEDHSIFYTNFIAIEFNSNHIKGSYNTQKRILNFNPNSHLPPPKI